MRAGLGGEADWGIVIQASLIHGTAPLLCRHLLDAVPDILPEPLRNATLQFLDGHGRAADLAISELVHVLDALGEAGIAAIPFKGPALADQAYGDPRLRSYRDLDFLIHEEQIQPTMHVLAELGFRSQASDLNARQMRAYRRYNGQDILFAEGRMPVEPHWAFAPSTFSAFVDMAGVWERAVPALMAGRTMQFLSPEDTLMVAVLHGAKERWARLLWISDIAEFLGRHPELEWDGLLCRVRQAGLLRILLLGLALAERLLDAPIPKQVQGLIQADEACQALIRQVEASLFSSQRAPESVFAISAFHWHARERLVDRLRYVFSTATTARIQHLRMIGVGAPLAFAYPAVKLLHDYLALPLWLSGKALLSGRPGKRSGRDAHE
ncbi:nucleotidyltransferase domain-containing protein [Roseomonas xinghualingensis]|uniref:nucleotidyltransferase domain-containing protein n=1 Tax=Roseomonas xinghualingensis TaxID=2986475 RepID=UPI0021F0D62F|nr:nucleotidyltransferase family protein [Roseomonas sp. SXEYE001]